MRVEGSDEGLSIWLLFGSSGLLGSSIASELQGGTVIMPTRSDFDVSQAKSLRDIVLEARPDFVINCLVDKRLDLLEGDADLGIAVNVLAPAAMAAACEEIGATFVHISADYVFGDGAAVLRAETSTPLPNNVYGQQKLLAEALIREASSSALILRPSWVQRLGSPCFLESVMQRLCDGEPVTAVDDVFGSPTSARALATSIVHGLEGGVPPGVYHSANSGRASWYELAVVIADEIGAPASLVRAASSSAFPTVAKRPSDTSLSSALWNEHSRTPLGDWAEAIRGEIAWEAQ